MHDKLNNEDSVKDVNNKLNEYFNIESLMGDACDSVLENDEEKTNDYENIII